MSRVPQVRVGDKVDATVRKVNLNVSPGAQVVSVVTSVPGTNQTNTIIDTLTVPTNGPIVANDDLLTLSHVGSQNMAGTLTPQQAFILGQ